MKLIYKAEELATLEIPFELYQSGSFGGLRLIVDEHSNNGLDHSQTTRFPHVQALDVIFFIENIYYIITHCLFILFYFLIISFQMMFQLILQHLHHI